MLRKKPENIIKGTSIGAATAIAFNSKFNLNEKLIAFLKWWYYYIPTLNDGEAAEIKVPNDTAVNETKTIVKHAYKNLSMSLYKPVIQ